MNINGFETLANADQGLLPGVLDNSLMSGLLADNGLLSPTGRNGLGSGLNLDSQELLDASERIRLEEERRLRDEERQRQREEDRFNDFNPTVGESDSPRFGGGGNSGFNPLSQNNELNQSQTETQTNENNGDHLIGISSTQTPIALSTDNHTGEGDEITGIPPNPGLINLPASHAGTNTVEPKISGTQLNSVQGEQVSAPEFASEENPATATNLASAEASLLSITDGLGMGEGFIIDLPDFPTEAVEAKLTQPNGTNPNNTQPNPIPPIFELEGIGVDNAQMTFILDENFLVDPNNPLNQKFYLESNDSVLGEQQATPGTMNLVRFIQGNEDQASRLLFQGQFQGEAAETTFVYGNLFLGALNWGYITLKEGKDFITYSGDEVTRNSTFCWDCWAPNRIGATTSPGSVYGELGDFYQFNTDLSIPGRGGLNYSFNRFYRSQIRRDSPLGNNWDHEYFQKLVVQIDGSVVHDNGLDREDRYLLNETGDGFISPPELFTQLKQLDNGSFTLREADGTVKEFDSDGKFVRMSDANDNFMSFLYNNPERPDQLTQVIDPMGRAIDYFYIDSGVNEGRLDKIVDFFGRVVDFTHDNNGDLVEVTSPAVTNTPNNANNFPNGKTTRYTYSSGFSNEALNHNLLTITRPNEVANGGPPVLVNEYGTSRFEFDKVISQTYGGVNASGVEAGGTHTFEYEQLTTGLFNDPELATNQPISRTTWTDSNGNVEVYEFNPLGYPVLIEELTKGLREDEPESFKTEFKYNADGRLVQQINPEDNEILFTYDGLSDSRFAHGNLLTSKQLPDAGQLPDVERGGDQTEIKTLNLYEPIYQQVSVSIDPRGIDESFTPPIDDPSGRSQRERYSTRFFFDYQEGDAIRAAEVLEELAIELGVSEAEVAALLEESGVELGLGDLNLDGEISTSIAGNVVAMVAPSVVLFPDSNQEMVEGDQLQDIVTLYRYNQFGQMKSMVDPEGNVHKFEYFSEEDPDGDEVDTVPPADGRVLDPVTGGYLKQEIRDAEHFEGANNGNEAEPTEITTNFKYDPVGNVIEIVDGRGILTQFVVNELNQVVRTIRAMEVPNVDEGDPAEPLQLAPFAYIEDIFYDFNDNIIERRVEDRGNTSNTNGFVDFKFTFDILDNLVEQREEVNVDKTLVTRFRYDPNENLTLTVLPEGNATSAQYDERDLLLVSTRGAFEATPETLSPPPATNPDDPNRPYDVRGGIPCQCTTYTYDGNRNLVKVVDSDDTDGSEANNGRIRPFDPNSDDEGDRTRLIYDGFDRLTSTIDSVGNQMVYQYDPASNMIRSTHFGPVGGMSPTDDGPEELPGPVSTNGVIQTDNLLNANLLAAVEILHDELNRTYQTDQVLFVNTISTERDPDVDDGATDIGGGDLTPNDDQNIPGIAGIDIIGRVSTRSEYDRKSRQTFMVEDDEDTFRIDYDGADRQIKTIDPEGNMVEFAYDDNDNLIETRETDIAQDEGLDVEVADEIFITTYFYDSLNRLQRTVDNLGRAMFYRYDSRDNLVAMADAQGPVKEATISRRVFSEGESVEINDFGNVTRYFYDGINRQTRQEVILTEIPEEFNGISTGDNSSTTLNDSSQSFETDTLKDRIVVITEGTGQGQMRQIVGNSDTEVTVSQDWETIPDDTSTYLITSGSAMGDGLHVGASIFGVKDDPTAPESFTPTPDAAQAGGDGIIRTGYTYDDNSLLSSLIDDQGNITLYLYDNLNRRVTETKGLVTTSPFTETFILGDRRVVTPTAATINDPAFIPEEKIQRQMNGAKLRIDEVASLFPPLADDVNDPPPPPQATTIVYGYDPDDNVLILEDENDTEVFTKFDAINRAIAVRVFRAGQTDSHEGDGIKPENDFDGPHRGPYPAIIGTNNENYEYDGLSRLTKATDNNDPDLADDDSTITYAYDSLSRVIEETQKIGSLDAQAISSSYRAENLRAGLTYPNDRQLEYTYDGLDRLKTVADEGASQPIAEYDYIGTYRILERRYPQNGTRLTFLNDAGEVSGYDDLRRPVQLRNLQDDGSLIVGFTHTYDRANNKLTEEKLHDPTNSEVYTYDSAYRLVRFQRPVEGAIQPLHGEWLLDGVGNWDQVDDLDRTHSSLNELLTEDGKDFNYDDNGNQTLDSSAGQDGEKGLRYEWDYRNRLRRVTREADDEIIAVYSYDAMNRRIRKVVTEGGVDNDSALNGTTDFYYDGWRSIEEQDGSNSLIQQYVFGVYLDEPLVIDRNLDGDNIATGPGDQRLFYHQNTLYNVYGLTDETGDILEAYQHDAYGKQTVINDGNGNGTVDFDGTDTFTMGASSEFNNPWMYTGQRFDSETGLYYYKNRYYSAEQGRFISRDPIGYQAGDANLYRYVFNSPTNILDPSGEGIWFLVIAAVAIAGGITYGYKTKSKPSLVGGLVPVVGPSRSAGVAFENKEYWTGTFYVCMACLDASGVGYLGKTVAKLGWRGLLPSLGSFRYAFQRGGSHLSGHRMPHIVFSAGGRPFIHGAGTPGIPFFSSGIRVTRVGVGVVEPAAIRTFPGVLNSNLAMLTGKSLQSSSCYVAAARAWNRGNYYIPTYLGSRIPYFWSGSSSGNLIIPPSSIGGSGNLIIPPSSIGGSRNLIIPFSSTGGSIWTRSSTQTESSIQIIGQDNSCCDYKR